MGTFCLIIFRWYWEIPSLRFPPVGEGRITCSISPSFPGNLYHLHYFSVFKSNQFWIQSSICISPSFLGNLYHLHYFCIFKITISGFGHQCTIKKISMVTISIIFLNYSSHGIFHSGLALNWFHFWISKCEL